MIWFGRVLWHINHCRLFNAKSSLYMNIKCIWFVWVLWHINHCRLYHTNHSWLLNAKFFLHTHTHKHIYIYIYIYMCVCVCVCVCIYIYDFWTHFVDNIFKRDWGYFFTQLNALISFCLIKHFYLQLIICLNEVKCFQVLPFNIHNSIKDQ